MNKTKIDWCNSSFNPIVGCYHECEYCYARKIAERFMTQGQVFEPDTYRLEYDGEEIIECNEQPYIIKDGKQIKQAYPYGFTPCFNRYKFGDFDKITGKNVFMGSMADMFGAWVPDRWLLEVFGACMIHPEHNYLFLTKNPKRYLDFFNRGELPGGDNFWYGTTVTNPNMFFAYTKNFLGSVMHHTFLSIEPILEDFEDFGGDAFVEWVIIGAETGNRKNKVIPKREWIDNIVNICRERNVPVFMKESLKGLMGDDFIQEFPEELGGSH